MAFGINGSRIGGKTLRAMAVFMAIALVRSTALSQERGTGRDDAEERPSALFFEPINLISEDSSLSRLDIPYRIDQSFFIPVKNNDRARQAAFLCRGEIAIELFDSLEVSKARSIQSIEISTDRPDREDPGRKWFKGLATFQAPPGPYKIVFEIDDLESERVFRDDRSKVRLRRFAGTHEMSTPMFVRWTNDSASVTSLEPVNFGPNLLFGEKAAIFVEIPPSGRDTVRTGYSISTIASPDRKPAVALAETLAAHRVLPHVRLECAKGSSVYSVSANDSSSVTGILIPLATEKLQLRRFELSLTVTSGAAPASVTKRFQTVWPDMPFSLRDVDYAINALKYITTDDQRDSLRHGSFEDRRDNLEAFWKSKSDNPSQAYNAVMVEYYRRVDHASREFGTLHDPDGFKSDRGRVYILYGPPTKTERTLSPTAGYQEVWFYEKPGRKFIFADQTRSGNYVLISMQPYDTN